MKSNLNCMAGVSLVISQVKLITSVNVLSHDLCSWVNPLIAQVPLVSSIWIDACLVPI